MSKVRVSYAVIFFRGLLVQHFFDANRCNQRSARNDLLQ